jgi:hypothetical protein
LDPGSGLDVGVTDHFVELAVCPASAAVEDANNPLKVLLVPAPGGQSLAVLGLVFDCSA